MNTPKITLGKRFLLSIIYLYVLNPFYFEIAPKQHETIFYIVILMYLIVNKKYIFMIFNNRRGLKIYFVFFIFIFAYSIISALSVPILYGTFDFSFFRYGPAIFIVYSAKMLFLIIITSKWLGNENILECFFSYFIKGMCLYVLSTIAMLVLPSFKDWWFSLLSTSQKREDIANNYVTRIGLIGFSGLSKTTICTVAVTMNLFLITEKINKRYDKKHIISLFLLLAGNLFYGRSGFLMSSICIGIVFIYISIFRNKFHYPILLCVFLVSVYSLLSNIATHNPEFSRWYEWALEPINNLIKGDGFESESMDVLLDGMYFVPELSTIIFGDGYLTDPVHGWYYMRTDAGFMRTMLFYGVINSFISYLLPLICIFGMLRGFKIIGKKKSGIIFCLISFLQIVFFEIKATAFYSETAFLLSILFVLSLNIKFINKKYY